MKTVKLLILGMLIMSLGMVSSASAICTLNDGIDTDKSEYVLGETVCFTIQLGATDCGGDVTNVNLYFFKPDNPPPGDPPLGCNDPEAGILVESGLTLVDGAAPLIFDCTTHPGILGWVVTQDDVDAGVLRGWYAVEFTKPGEEQSCDQDNASATVTPPEPCIEITKEVDCDVSKVGDTVTYYYCIHNCGPLELEITDITDTVVPDDDVWAALVAEGCLILAPDDEEPDGDDECCFDVEYEIQEGDDDPLVNEVVVYAVDTEFGQETQSDPDDATVDLVDPSFTVTKDCREEPLEVGDTAIFDIRVENTGDVCLHFELTELGEPVVFDLAEGDYREWETHIDVETEDDVINTIIGIATLLPGDPPGVCGEASDCLPNEYPVEASDTCSVTGGATRTPGYWKTHYYMAEYVFNECYPDGIDFGWTYVDNVNELMAIFHAKKAKLNKLCQARLQASFHFGAAILNDCIGLDFESFTGLTKEGVAETMGGCDINAIKGLIGPMGAYNEYGDDVELVLPMGLTAYNATPKLAKKMSEGLFDEAACEDCVDGMTSASSNKGKGPKK